MQRNARKVKALDDSSSSSELFGFNNDEGMQFNYKDKNNEDI